VERHAGVPRALPRFIGVVLLWLPVAFALWYFAAPILLWPAKLVVDAIARTGLHDIVDAVEQHGSVLTFATTLRPGLAETTSARVTVDVNALLYSIGLPLYAALVVGARDPGWLRKLAVGYVVLVPVIAFGVLADFLKNVAITAAPLIASQTGFSPLSREAIAFAYQLGSLILPTVVPAVTWVLLHRGLLERLRREK